MSIQVFPNSAKGAAVRAVSPKNFQVAKNGSPLKKWLIRLRYPIAPASFTRGSKSPPR
ncbi:MAG: hypothetical protein QGH40_01610 [bacterium]|nr:hypothetical protein [bacterium]